MSLEDKRESELMACSRHLGKVLVKMRVGTHGVPHSGPSGQIQKDATACLQSYFEDQKTRAAFVFDGETGNTDGQFLPPVSATCVCIHCCVGVNGAFKVRFQVSSFHQLPVGWLGSALPEWSSSVLSQSESSYRPWWGGKTARCEGFQSSNHFKATNRQAFIAEFE